MSSDDDCGYGRGLVLQLQHDDPTVRLGVVVALGEIGEAASRHAPHLSLRLADGDSVVAKNAAEALTNMGPAGAAALVLRLSEENTDEVQLLALEALGSMGDDAVPHIPEMMKRLEDPDVPVRLSAAKALQIMGPHAESCVAALAGMLDDVEPSVREGCTRALYDIGPAGVGALVARLSDANAFIRQRSLEAILEVAHRAKDYACEIAGCLADSFMAVRRAAAVTLQGMGAEGATAAGAYLHHRDLSVRQLALETLGNAGLAASPFADVIAALLDDSQADVRHCAVKTLGMLGTEASGRHAKAMARLLKDDDATVRDAATTALVAFGEVGAEATVPYLNSRSLEARRCAMRGLNKMGVHAKQYIREFRELLMDRDADIARDAADLVCKLARCGELPDMTLVLEDLAKELDGKDLRVRLIALDTFGLVGSHASKHLRRILSHMADPAACVRQRVIMTLGQIGAPAVTPYLKSMESLLEDPEGDVRLATVECFTALGMTTTSASTAVLRRLQDKEAAVRKAALQYAGELGETCGRYASIVLNMYLADADADVQTEAARTLPLIGRAGMAVLTMRLDDMQPEIRTKVVRALGMAGSLAVDATEAIARLLEDPDEEVMAAAADALGAIGEDYISRQSSLVDGADSPPSPRSPRSPKSFQGDARGSSRANDEKKLAKQAAEALAKSAAGSSSLKLRRGTIRALGKLGAHGAKHAAQIANEFSSEDLDLRMEACRAMGRLGLAAEAYIDRLAELLSDPEPRLRTVVLETLSDLGTQASRTAPVVVMYLDDKDTDARQACFHCLLALGPAGIDAVAARIHDPSAFVRQTVIKALGEFGDDAEQYAPLVATMLGDSAFAVSWNAVLFLRDIGEAGPAALAACLEQQDASVRQNAAKAMGEMGENAAPQAMALAARLEDRYVSIRKTAAATLRKMGESAVEALCQGLQEDEAFSRRVAVKALGVLGAQAAGSAAALRDLAFDASDSVRREAFKSLTVLGPSGLDVLADILSHEELSVRRAAVGALASVGVAAIGQAEPAFRRRACEAMSHMGELTGPHCFAMAQLLDDKDEGVQQAALTSLVGLAAAGACAIVARCCDPDPGLRCICMEALGDIGLPDTMFVDAAVVGLKDEDFFVKRAAVQTLGKLAVNGARDEKVLKLLAECLVDVDACVRKRAADALGQVGIAPESVEIGKEIVEVDKILASRLEDTNNCWGWCSAATSLRGTGKADQAHAEKLAASLKDPNKTVRWSALAAMEKLGNACTAYVENIASLVHDEEPTVRRAVAGVLGRLGPPALPYAAELATLVDDADVLVRMDAAEALGLLGPGAAAQAAVLAGRLTDADPWVRRNAVVALGRLGAVAAEQHALTVKGLLGDYNTTVRQSSVDCLVTIGAPAAAICAEHLEDPDPRMRRCLVEVLGAIGMAAAAFAGRLCGRLRDSDSFVRQAVIASLKQMGAAAGVAAAELLDDPDPVMRGHGLDALGELGGEVGALHAAAIADALEDSDAQVRRKAAQVLGQIDEAGVSHIGKLVTRVANCDVGAAESCMESIRRLGDAAAPYAPTLARRLQDNNATVRRHAAESLGQLGGAAQPYTMDLARQLQDDGDALVRRACAEALGRLGRASAAHAAAIASCLRDVDNQVRAKAAEALGQLGIAAQPFADDLTKLLDDDDQSVWQSAANALGSMPELTTDQVIAVARRVENSAT
eukprot:TRINITY_DN29092_c0_g1_i2.p1 TRINITY_DN29092_c0_g1~~TRINITY_DN29092_c0_g1_i2.p1  ORF type:complete len:1696 (-),score=382.06 TRINITY_DN29092_c0_g1_i2:399-5486(-)